MDEEKKDKVKEVLDEPGIALEQTVKKGWGAVKKLGKDVKDKIIKEKKEEKK
jgi:hypothetical protein